MDRVAAFGTGRALRSSLWRTTPVDCPPGSPAFVNAVVGFEPVEGETPETLLLKLQGLEREFGRVARVVVNEPRSLDLDLIAFGSERRSDEALTLPHPRAHQRRFVLEPLAEIAPALVLPGQTRTVAELLAGLDTDEVLARVVGPEPVMHDVVLYEALLWEPPSGYFLLEAHLERLQRSAAHFRFALEVDAVRKQLLAYGHRLPQEPRKVRLELAAQGEVTLGHEIVKPSTAVPAVLSREPIDSSDEFLRHKTARRAVFQRALAAHPEAQDVVLWNERGELTETCYGNLVFEIQGRKLTPSLSSGLLPGVFRAHLLDRGVIQEQLLLLDSIEKATAIFLINSVRRWCELRLVSAVAGA